jgi:hypothetical protein
MVDSFPPVTFTLGAGKNEKEHTVIPETVPWSDKSYLRHNQIGEFNKAHWKYCCLKTGEIAFIKYRTDNADGSKSFQYMSFANGKWWRKNLFDELANQHGIKKDLYKANYLQEEEGRDPDTVDLVEGEKTCDSARKKFEDLHFTTYGGASGYKNFDFSILKGKKVLLHHDIEDSEFGKDKFEELCLYLIEEYEIDARVVPYPSYDKIRELLRGAFDKNGWGLEDTIPEELDIYDLREKAYVPEPPPTPVKTEYSDIRSALKEFYSVRGTGGCFYEIAKRKLVEKSEINDLFLRAKEEQGFSKSASEWLHRNKITVTDGLTYYPTDKALINIGNETFVNKYVPPVHEDLGDIPDIKEKLDWFFKLVSYTCEYEEYETDLLIKTFACAVQYPEENRAWVLLISSHYHGTGKGLLFQLLYYLLGKKNCNPVKLPALSDKFNGWQLEGNNIFVAEANNKGKEDSHTVGSLKHLTTEDFFQVELKGKEKVTVNCHYNIYLTTNELKPYSTEQNDRRHFYIRHELLPLSDEFYEDILFNKIRAKDKKDLKLLAHYLKNVFKITREECRKFYGTLPKTRWHHLLLQDSLTGYMKELKIVKEQKLIPSFHWGLYNVNLIYAELRKFMYSDNKNEDYILSELPSKDQIEKFLKAINCGQYRTRIVIDKKGREKKVSDAIEPRTLHNHKPRGNYWVDPEWIEYFKKHNRDISKVNEHFDDPLTYARAYKDKDKLRQIELDGRANPKHIGDLLERERQFQEGEIPF